MMVVFAHAATYRYVEFASGSIGYLVLRLTEPLASLGVPIFFVISGYIITTLLLREEAERGVADIPAFYIRRTFRILPPLFAYYLTLIVLALTETISLPFSSLVSSATFTCNTGIVDCVWWVSHTWSLAVEEQFYLGWPLLFLLMAGQRSRLLAIAIVAMVIGLLIQAPPFQSNFLSFACIAAGALYATSESFRHVVQRASNGIVWLLVVAFLVVFPLTDLQLVARCLLPPLIVYTVFVGNQLKPVRAILESKPLQWLGLCSYSLYLWQQLFLASPSLYLKAAPPLVLLPVVVIASVWLVEKPFIRLGHRLSAMRRKQAFKTAV